jgi:hypothetical protein
LGAALVAANAVKPGFSTRFRGFAAIQALNYKSTTAKETVCTWCEVNCQRTFIDVEIENA